MAGVGRESFVDYAGLVRLTRLRSPRAAFESDKRAQHEEICAGLDSRKRAERLSSSGRSWWFLGEEIWVRAWPAVTDPELRA